MSLKTALYFLLHNLESWYEITSHQQDFVITRVLMLGHHPWIQYLQLSSLLITALEHLKYIHKHITMDEHILVAKLEVRNVIHAINQIKLF